MKKRLQRTLAVLVTAVALIAIAAVPAYATIYHGCPSGQGCIWENKDGGGDHLAIPVGTYGYNVCWSVSGTVGDNTVSSASADYGGGWDLRLYNNGNCTSNFVNRYDVETSEFVNFTGSNAWMNDITSSFMITQT